MPLQTFKLLSIAALFSSSVLLSSAVSAHSEGDLFARAGLGTVLPNESSNTPNAGVGELSLDNVTNLAGTVTYMMSDSLGIEVLLGLPFTHEVSASVTGVNGGAVSGVADVSHLPLSVTAQHYFAGADSDIRPYVGAGFNYTTFLDEEGKGALNNKTVSVDNSFGFAIQAGVDYKVNEQLFLNVSAWYLDIESTVESSGVTEDIDVVIDPLAILFAVGYTF